MDRNNQLLCTFAHRDAFEDTIGLIESVYDLVFGKIYVLENLGDESQLVLTYNASRDVPANFQPPPSTISVHRKKQTNTIYTINALNALIKKKTGKLDIRYKVDWEALKNSVLVTAYGELKIVNTRLSTIIELPLDN